MREGPIPAGGPNRDTTTPVAGDGTEARGERMAKGRRSSLYFAYGNNLHPDTMARRCGTGFRERSVARLRDHRLAFAIETENWAGGRVATIVPEHDFYVYGYLYELDEEALRSLDEAEYVADRKYERRTFSVEVVSPDRPYESDAPPLEAFTYVVTSDEQLPDGAPHQGYIERVIAAAELRELPGPYLAALRSMQAAPGTRSEELLLALPTRHRGPEYMDPIIQLPRARRRALGVRRWAYVHHGENTCLAKVVDLPERRGAEAGVCRVDESIRRALGIPALEPGIEFYGGYVRVSPAPSRRRRQVIPARSLQLRMAKVDYLDCEKRLAVMDRSLLSILGIEVGDYVRITAVRWHSDTGKFTERSVTRRAFTGSTSKRREGGVEKPYPEEGVIHLDFDTRAELGFEDAYVEYHPVRVAASTWDLVQKRFLLYGAGILAATLAIHELAVPLLSSAGTTAARSGPGGVAVSLAVALVLGALAVGYNVKRKVQP